MLDDSRPMNRSSMWTFTLLYLSLSISASPSAHQGHCDLVVQPA